MWEQLTEANRLLEQGNQQCAISQFEAALQSWQQALIICREIKDCQGEGMVIGNIGIAYCYLGNYPKAIDYHQQSLEIARLLKDRSTEGKALTNLGNAYYSLGNYPKAINYHHQALDIARVIKDRQDEGIALGNIGIVYFSLGNYSIAIDYYQQHCAIARSIKDYHSEAKALGNIGSAYASLGDYQKAIDYGQQWLVIARLIKDRQSEGMALCGLGNAYCSLGNYSKAIDYLQQSLDIARPIKDLNTEGKALGCLGNVYNSLGNYLKAIDYLQQHLAIARLIKDCQGEGMALGNIGNIYFSLRNYPKAINYYQQVLESARAITDRQSEGAALGCLGNVYCSLGNYLTAIDYYQQALKISRAIKDLHNEGAVLGSLGNAYFALGDYKKVIFYDQQWLQIARSIKDRLGEGMALGNLGLALFSQGENLVTAENFTIEAINVWESLRVELDDTNKVSIFETQIRTYKTLQQILIDQNKIEAALLIAERGRARAFVELLSSRLALQITDTNQPNLEQVKHIAKAQNATLVQYSIINESFLCIWVIKSTGEIVFHHCELSPLWQQKNISLSNIIFQARRSLGVETKLRDATPTIRFETPLPIRHISQELQLLHQYLIQPIAYLLPADPNASVIFIPEGDLFLVPFGALQDTEGKFLIEHHTIVTAPSIQVLELTRKQRQRVRALQLSPKNQDALVVGNPTMPTIPLQEPLQPLDSLPGAEAEAKAIALLLQTQAIIGHEATKEHIVQLLPQARLIHLATHGLLDDIRQLGVPGAIALAPSEGDNGFLTAGEILEMKLQAELVVVSACSSGQGKITGDGVIGLSRSLFLAGVPTVIVSLWSVGDDSTEFLMTQFYQNLLQRPFNKAQALRQAMLTTMKEYPNPFSWAAFTLIGEAE